jgi:hypothetical protein
MAVFSIKSDGGIIQGLSRAVFSAAANEKNKKKYIKQYITINY